MTRRQMHALLLVSGVTIATTAVLNRQMRWVDRSDLFLVGVVTVGLGMHGLWKTDPPLNPCSECGRPNKRGGRFCSACYQRRYFHDPVLGAERRAKNIERVKAYTKAHPEKRLEWVRNWKRRSMRMWG